MNGPKRHSSLPVDPSPEARAYTEAQFRRLYPIGRTKFWQEIRGGRLVASKLGGRVMVFREDADAWARANSAPITAAS
jgi:hypothetical protein